MAMNIIAQALTFLAAFGMLGWGVTTFTGSLPLGLAACGAVHLLMPYRYSTS